MQILSLNFLVYTIIGLWRPIKWSSKCSKLLYGVYSFLSIYLLTYMMLTNMLYIIFVIDDLEGLVACSSIFLSIICVCFKAITIIIRRDQITNLIEILQKRPLKAYDEEEADIQMKFDHTIRSYSMSYIILSTFSATCGVMGGMLYMLDGEIPYGFAWVPWECTSFLLFCFTSVQEIIALVIGIFVNVATETMVVGFCLQICARFEILKHRLRRMIKRCEKEDIPKNLLNNTSNTISKLSEHVSHHICIIRLAEMINDVFRQIIFVQFFISILVLCLIIYYLSSHVTFTDISTYSVYVICMFVQIFLYCWAGNEVTLKSIELGDEIFYMDWIVMTRSEQKDLMMIMNRSARPIKFTSSFLVTMSLESYANLLKTSFSAFNLLQQM